MSLHGADGERLREDLTALVLRAVVGSIFVAQGWRKSLSRIDAPHGRAALKETLERNGWPAADQLPRTTGVVELTCGTAVIVGLKTRLALIPLLGILGVAIAHVKWSDGFLGGWDWPYSVAGAAVASMVLGEGRFSAETALRRNVSRAVDADWRRTRQKLLDAAGRVG